MILCYLFFLVIAVDMLLLHCRDCQLVTDQGLLHLARLTGLQYLNLMRVVLHPEICRLIMAVQLHVIALLCYRYCRRITGQGFVHLARVTGLKHLDVG